jgi:hypothetical protein
MLKTTCLNILTSILCFILTTVNIVAQEDKLRQEVRAMFSADKKDLWIHQLSGLLDGIHKIDMTIGTDGKECKGIYSLRSSNLTFYFEGEDTGEHIRLLEMTKSGKFSGYIMGNYDGKNLNAIWMDVKKIQQIPMTASVQNSSDTNTQKECNSPEWIAKYLGKIDGERVKLTVHYQKDRYRLLWHTADRIFSDIYTDDLTHSMFPELSFSGTVLNQKKLNLKSITESTSADNAVQILSGNEVFKLNLTARLNFDCYEYASFSTRWELIRPNPDKPRFSAWLEQNFKQWFSDNQKKLVMHSEDEFSTSERWAHNIYGWVEVDLFNADLISGTVYRQHSHEINVQKHAFIYDLSSGKELKISELFEKNFDASDYIRKVIKARKKELQVSPVMRKWINGQDFMNISLKSQGVSCRTAFHTVYGEHEILIPYQDIKDKIKLRTLLKELNPE